MMTPQLWINYRTKSVAHLPWRTLVYKSLNTFIDDLFAFIVKMPDLHRLSCFRDGALLFLFCFFCALSPGGSHLRGWEISLISFTPLPSCADVVFVILMIQYWIYPSSVFFPLYSCVRVSELGKTSDFSTSVCNNAVDRSRANEFGQRPEQENAAGGPAPLPVPAPAGDEQKMLAPPPPSPRCQAGEQDAREAASSSPVQGQEQDHPPA